MNEYEIIKYAEAELARGINLIEIKQSMLARGWKDYDIQKALRDSGIDSREKEEEKEEKRKNKEVEDNSVVGWDKKSE